MTMTRGESTSRYSSVTSASTESSTSNSTNTSATSGTSGTSGTSDITVKPLPALPPPREKARSRNKDNVARPPTKDASSRQRSSSNGSSGASASRRAAAPTRLKTDEHASLFRSVSRLSHCAIVCHGAHLLPLSACASSGRPRQVCCCWASKASQHNQSTARHPSLPLLQDTRLLSPLTTSHTARTQRN